MHPKVAPPCLGIDVSPLLPANCCWFMQGFFIFIRAVKTLTQHNKGVVVVRKPSPLHQPTWQLCMGCCRSWQLCIGRCRAWHEHAGYPRVGCIGALRIGTLPCHLALLKQSTAC